jgi:hypothetical protein
MHGEKLSCLLGKFSGGDERNNGSFPVKRESLGYVVFIWDKSYLGHQDLACKFVEMFFAITWKTSAHMNRLLFCHRRTRFEDRH